jgi:hypothetical protein
MWGRQLRHKVVGMRIRQCHSDDSGGDQVTNQRLACTRAAWIGPIHNSGEVVVRGKKM